MRVAIERRVGSQVQVGGGQRRQERALGTQLQSLVSFLHEGAATARRSEAADRARGAAGGDLGSTG